MKHILVCPFQEELISQLNGKDLVIRLNDIYNIERVANIVNNRNNLHCALVNTKYSLASISFKDNWQNIPIALYVSDMGSFLEMLTKITILRQLNIRIYLSENLEHVYTNIMLLSSLGIYTGLAFDQKNSDWESINNLMHYAIYGKSKHAPIEPFHYIASNYRINKPTDFGSVYFDDPRKYLHVSEAGNVALSNKELQSKVFVSNSLNNLENIENSQDYVERINAWRDFFIKPDGCAYCQGWRICLGKFSDRPNSQKKDCEKFFVDLMEASEYFQSRQQEKKACGHYNI
ncbi:MAG: hypothetical protein HQL06_16690 [Nitrospirae bacterium]|nr:hypothetical protein [Nitrospirota bacterium]